MSHLGIIPFSNVSQYGWGAWRSNREFVGKINYGTRQILWTKEIHTEVRLDEERRLSGGLSSTTTATTIFRHRSATAVILSISLQENNLQLVAVGLSSVP